MTDRPMDGRTDMKKNDYLKIILKAIVIFIIEYT